MFDDYRNAREIGDEATIAELEDALVQQHDKLCHYVVHKWMRSHPRSIVADYDDLVQTCRLALLRAIRSFDPERGAFSTYAVKCMHYALWELYAKNNFAVTFSGYAITQFHAWKRGEDVDDRWNAIFTNIRQSNKPYSFHADDDDDDRGLEETYGETDDINIELHEALEQLSERERRVVEALYGLDGTNSERTLEEVARLFDVSKQAIHQIRNKALRKLREWLE